jgi:hypothetical protein
VIKFFRHIRQRLIKENRVSKYLIYAAGEIVLVVIGILIALQINNWNENRKEAHKAQELFEELYNELERVQRGLEQTSSGNALYTAYLEETLAAWDSLDYDLLSTFERHNYAEVNLSTLFYLTTYSEFVGAKKDVYLKALGDGTLTLIDQEFVGFISYMHRMIARMDEMIAQEYEIGKAINLHISENYGSLLLPFKRVDEKDLDTPTLNQLLIAFREDGKLKYLINTRLELARIRGDMIDNLNEFTVSNLKVYKAQHRD